MVTYKTEGEYEEEYKDLVNRIKEWKDWILRPLPKWPAVRPITAPVVETELFVYPEEPAAERALPPIEIEPVEPEPVIPTPEEREERREEITGPEPPVPPPATIAIGHKEFVELKNIHHPKGWLEVDRPHYFELAQRLAADRTNTAWGDWIPIWQGVNPSPEDPQTVKFNVYYKEVR